MVGAWGHTFREAQTAWVTEINLFIRIANPVTLTLSEIGNLPPQQYYQAVQTKPLRQSQDCNRNDKKKKKC